MRQTRSVIPTGAVSRKGDRRSGEPALSLSKGICFPHLRAVLYMTLVAALVAFGAHASDTANGPRYEKLSHAIMCPCGCNQLLGECNHVGCPDSDKMRSQLAASIDHGDDDTTIFHAFQDEYGATALAAPMFTRLNQFSWWVPPLVLVLGICGVFFVVRRWRPRTVAMPAAASDPHTLVLEQRIRMETGGNLGRETGGDLS